MEYDKRYEEYDDMYSVRNSYNDLIGTSSYNCGIRDLGKIYLLNDWVIKKNKLNAWFGKSDIINGVVVNNTAKAIQFEYKGDRIWIPKSQIHVLE